MNARRNVYVNPHKCAYDTIVHRRWFNKTFYTPTEG